MPYKDRGQANARRRERYYANLDHERARSRAKYSREHYLAWKARYPDGLWEQWLKKAHGMAPEQWFAMLTTQDGACYVCERPLPDDRSQIVVDHDHECCGEKRSCGYCRRGLAHKGCNGWVGLFGEDIELMYRAVANFARTQAQAKALIMTKPVQGELTIG